MAKLVHNVQKKQHKERSQTLDRAKYGLLEKKKDYKLRAADFHKKQAALKVLKQKAAQYNPDEYYHAMTRKKTDENGIAIIERESSESLSAQQLKLLKSQDANYVKTMRLNEMQKIEKLKNKLEFKSSGKHTIFVDSVEEKEQFNPEEYFKTDLSMLERRENRLRVDQLETSNKLIKRDLFTDQEERDRLEKEKLNEYRLLKERMKREKQLREVEQKMEMAKELMKNGDRRKLVDSDGNVHFKWKTQRKR